MSRVRPANIRQTSKTLRYPTVGTSKYYYAFQLKQQLALSHALGNLGKTLVFPCASLKPGKLSVLQPANLPLNIQLRAQKYLCLQLTSSKWFVNKTVACASVWLDLNKLKFFETLNLSKVSKKIVKPVQTSLNQALVKFVSRRYQRLVRAFNKTQFNGSNGCVEFGNFRLAKATPAALTKLGKHQRQIQKFKKKRIFLSAQTKPLKPKLNKVLAKRFHQAYEALEFSKSQKVSLTESTRLVEESLNHQAYGLVKQLKQPLKALKKRFLPPILSKGDAQKMKKKRLLFWPKYYGGSSKANFNFLYFTLGLITRKSYAPSTNDFQAAKTNGLLKLNQWKHTRARSQKNKKFYDFLFLTQLNQPTIASTGASAFSRLVLKKQVFKDPWLCLVEQKKTKKTAYHKEVDSNLKVLGETEIPKVLKTSEAPRHQRNLCGLSIEEAQQPVLHGLNPLVAQAHRFNRPLKLVLMTFNEGSFPFGVRQQFSQPRKNKKTFLNPHVAGVRKAFKKILLKPSEMRLSKLVRFGLTRLRNAVRFELKLDLQANKSLAIRQTTSVRL